MPSKFSSKLFKLVPVFLVCAILVFWNPASFFSPVRAIILKIAYPFQKAFYSVSGQTRDAFVFLGSISELKKENENLIRENASLKAETAALAAQKKENESLRNQLKLAPKDKFKLESARVIAADSKNSGSWLMIDKGRSQGIDVGMPVIVSDGILVGKISETFAGVSKISLLTDTQSNINVSDLETEAQGIVKGEYNLGLVLDMVEQTDILNEGDRIITSSLGGSMPEGLLVGRIQKTQIAEDKLFQQAIVIPGAKYSKLTIVHVIK